MFVLGKFVGALAMVLHMVLNLYFWIVVIRALISWVNPDPYNPVVKFLHAATDPVLKPIRRALGFNMPIDFSPIIVILVIYFLDYFLVGSLQEFAMRLGRCGGGLSDENNASGHPAEAVPHEVPGL